MLILEESIIGCGIFCLYSKYKHSDNNIMRKDSNCIQFNKDDNDDNNSDIKIILYIHIHT